MDLEVGKTQRGFSVMAFKDKRGDYCSMQKSSDALNDCIWFGKDDPAIIEFEAPTYGPHHVIDLNNIKQHPDNRITIDSRMYLTREQVKELLPYLQKFAETGDLL